MSCVTEFVLAHFEWFSNWKKCGLRIIPILNSELYILVGKRGKNPTIMRWADWILNPSIITTLTVIGPEGYSLFIRLMSIRIVDTNSADAIMVESGIRLIFVCQNSSSVRVRPWIRIEQSVTMPNKTSSWISCWISLLCHPFLELIWLMGI